MSASPSAPPRVSVVIPTYNGERYIEAAVTSVLQQTYGDFELIVIDDGSQDGTWPKLAQLARRDARIVLQRNAANLGISAARNLGTELARGEFVAIMDGDDVCLPDRLEKQVAYLSAHPKIGAVGGMIQRLEGEVLGEVRDYPHTPGLLAWYMCFFMPASHPACMVRHAVLVAAGGYDPAYRVAHDYDLWFRLSRQSALANLPDIVLRYRRHGHNISSQRAMEMSHEIAQISRRAIEAEIGVTITPDEALLLRTRHHPTPRRTVRLSRLLYRLAYHIKHKHHLTADEWQALRHDATRRILRLVWRQGDLPSAAAALACVARLDPMYALRWLSAKPYAAAQRNAAARLGTG